MPILDRDQLFYLSQINIFTDLDRETLERVNGISPMATVPAGKVLFGADDSPSVLYMLKRGRVRLYRMSDDGRVMTLAILGDGNVFGSTASVALHSRDIYAETMESSLLCAMHQRDVEHMLRDFPSVGLRFMQLLSARVTALEEQLERLAHEDVRKRLVQLLTTLADQFGVPDAGPFTRINLSLTHADLASMVASTRETVSGTLAALSRESLVRTNRRQVSIDRERARTLLARAWPA